ncbi:hypothetical protein [Polymorphospora lycopeni]|uniref:Uncharacterized protein n=1 Tax=Polymorphospora lycopeni TaxID=3140240 RepID=A0ABV5CKY0_9ACTN
MIRWQWEAVDPGGTARISGVQDDWRRAGGQAVAEEILARLILRAKPYYGRAEGWKIRAWQRGLEGEAVEARASDWLNQAGRPL